MQPIKPHWAWFLAGPAVLVVGCVAAVVVLVVGSLSVAEGMQRVSVPGEATISIKEAGDTTIFYEQMGVSQATIPEGLTVIITPAGGGEPLELTQGRGRFTYADTQAAGRNFRNVSFPHAGEYHVVTSLPPGSSAGGRVALGGSPGAALAGTLVGFFGIGIASFLLCVIIMLVVGLRRVSYRKRLLAQPG
jgi:hypothetical protein